MQITREHLVRALLLGACSVDGLLGRDVESLDRSSLSWVESAGVVSAEDRAGLVTPAGIVVVGAVPLHWMYGSGYGYGYGDGDGDGYGYGDGDGDGDGSGYGSGYGYGYGYGYGDGDGDGDGNGDGYGSGDGYGYGNGYGDCDCWAEIRALYAPAA